MSLEVLKKEILSFPLYKLVGTKAVHIFSFILLNLFPEMFSDKISFLLSKLFKLLKSASPKITACTLFITRSKSQSSFKATKAHNFGVFL